MEKINNLEYPLYGIENIFVINEEENILYVFPFYITINKTQYSFSGIAIDLNDYIEKNHRMQYKIYFLPMENDILITEFNSSGIEICDFIVDATSENVKYILNVPNPNYEIKTIYSDDFNDDFFKGV